jgi:branched-subunit amino acid aminotransferase/4-amino-4-deoxychorismate lyase
MTTPAQLAVMIDGVLADPDAPVRVTMDDGLIRGDGVFEGMRFYGRRPRTPDAHLERLAKSGAGAGIPIDVELLRDEMAAFCDATVNPDCGVRLMVTRGGIRIWREEPLPSFGPEGIGLLPVAHRVTPLLVGVKTLSYSANMRAQRLARDQGMNDALLYRADDRVILEGPTTSFGWIEGDTLVFPPLDAGVLDSITRRIATEAVPTVEREMVLDDLAKVDGALLMSSYQQAVPVHTVLGVATFDVTRPVVIEMADVIEAAIQARVESLQAATR